VSRVPNAVEEFIHAKPVTPSIWPRRLLHVVTVSSIPVAILIAPTELMQWSLVAGSVAAVILELLRGLLPWANDLAIRYLPFFKPFEQYQVTGATFMVLGATATYFAFGTDVTVLALLFLAVGDPLAALIGRRDHYVRFFGKSVVGSAAFVLGATTVGVLVAQHPDIPLAWWLVPGAFSAALAELLPLPVDDNLSVPLFAAAVMTLLAMI
jgi:dolichol kinase